MCAVKPAKPMTWAAMASKTPMSSSGKTPASSSAGRAAKPLPTALRSPPEQKMDTTPVTAKPKYNVWLSAVWIFEISNRKSIRFDLKRAQLFQIFEYLPSPISYIFNRMTPLFHLSNHAYQPTQSTNMEPSVGPLWLTKYWNSYNRNHNSAVP